MMRDGVVADEIVLDRRSLILRGIAAIAFGVLALVWPGITLAALVLLFGAYLLVDGVSILIGVLRGEATRRERVILIVDAVASIAIGLITFFWPALTALALVFLIAARALISGVLQVVAAVRLRKVIRDEWFLVGGGVLSVAFGVLVAIFPGAGALAITWLIGWYAIVFGVLFLGAAWRVRQVALRTEVRFTGRPAAA
jgi:uncharacterized membrane protein HdeD (DUF308 family)